jgi:uncharacterized protein (DUF4415 family)
MNPQADPQGDPREDQDPLDAEIDFGAARPGPARPGPVLPADPTKTRITINLDAAVIAWFKDQVAETGGSYQSLINETLKEHMRGQQQSEQLERTLRRVLREELASSQTA